jgi:FkbM family methyltransferase
MKEVEFKSKRDGKNFIIRENSYDRVIIDGEWPGYQKKIVVSSRDVWLDIGAHIGAFTLRIAPHVQEVHSYEADPENFEVLKKNRALNPEGTVYLHHGAVVGMCKAGDKVSFYKNKGTNTGLHSLVTKRGRDKIEVPAWDVKQVIFESKANKIKMDIEGGEWDLFQNFDPPIFNQIDEIIMEYHFSALRDVDHLKYMRLLERLKEYYPTVESKAQSFKQWTTMIYASRTR